MLSCVSGHFLFVAGLFHRAFADYYYYATAGGAKFWVSCHFQSDSIYLVLIRDPSGRSI